MMKNNYENDDEESQWSWWRVTAKLTLRNSRETDDEKSPWSWWSRITAILLMQQWNVEDEESPWSGRSWITAILLMQHWNAEDEESLWSRYQESPWYWWCSTGMLKMKNHCEADTKNHRDIGDATLECWWRITVKQISWITVLLKTHHWNAEDEESLWSRWSRITVILIIGHWNAKDESRWSRCWCCWWRITSKLKKKNNRKPINKRNSESDTES
jgi:hypothetical protein